MTKIFSHGLQWKKGSEVSMGLAVVDIVLLLLLLLLLLLAGELVLLVAASTMAAGAVVLLESEPAPTKGEFKLGEFCT
jgi:hypothetical protein